MDGRIVSLLGIASIFLLFFLCLGLLLVKIGQLVLDSLLLWHLEKEPGCDSSRNGNNGPQP